MKWPSKLEEIKPKTWILALVLIGLILRFYSSIYTPISTAEEKVYMPLALGTSTSSWQKLSTLLHGPIYFYMEDISYRIFGYGYFAGRFFPVIFSSVSIILIYLLARELYDQRTALLAALIFTVMSSQIIYGSRGLFEPIYTLLLLFSFLFFIRWVKYNKKLELFSSAAFFAVAAATKIVAFYFLPALVVYYLLSKKQVSARQFVAPIVLIILLFSPLILYNYFLYTEKGLADFFVTRFFNLENSKSLFRASNVAGIDDHWIELSNLNYYINYLFTSITPYAWLLIVLGLISIISLRQKESDGMLLTGIFVPLFFYMIYVFHPDYSAVLSAPFSIVIAKGIESLALFAGNKQKLALAVLASIFIVNELYALMLASPGISADMQLRDFAATLPETAILITDPKIHYLTAMMFTPQIKAHAMTSTALISVYSEIKRNGISYKNSEPLDAYVVLCESDICWLDKTPSRLTDPIGFREAIQPIMGAKVSDIYQNGTLIYSIYYLPTASITSVVLPYIENFTFFAYRIGHPELSVDVYSLHSPFDQFLNLIGHAALYTDILLALSAPLVAVYMFLKEEQTHAKSQGRPA